jgi:hypothetical protein
MTTRNLLWMRRLAATTATTTTNNTISSRPPIIISYPQYRYFTSSKSGQEHPHGMFEEQLREMQEEREAMYEFTPRDKQAWSQQSTTTTTDQVPSEIIDQINQARLEHAAREDAAKASSLASSSSYHDSSFTHITRDGQSIHMVDVGDKRVTKRMARAQTRVVFPPQVMDAFVVSGSTTNNNELIGPKGPIFATAKVAGIMAAK